MSFFIPHYKPNQLICGEGHVAVVTGWTVRQSVAKRLREDEYAVIGNLYSPTRGIGPLLRNLLANPQVKDLVILAATKEDKNAGSCQCLLDFFQHGFQAGKSETRRDCWVINSDIPGYIDAEIPQAILEQLRHAVDYYFVSNLNEALEQIQHLARRSPIISSATPQLFPITEVLPSTLPGPRYGHRIEGNTIAETWVKILHRIKSTGTIRPTQYGQWQELIDLTAIVTEEPDDFYFPDPNFLPIQPEFIPDYIAQMLEDAPQQEGVKYTYGQRLRSWFGRDQIQQAISKLQAEPDSSRVVMNLWDALDYENTDSPPCLNHIWIRIVDQELSLTATFRSNDMFSAWPANAMGLRALQRHILDQLVTQGIEALRMGPLITISQSAHIYSDCWEHADRVIEQEYKKAQDKRDEFDPSGSFLISLQDTKIVVEHLTPGSGEVVDCYSGTSAKKIYRHIAHTCPTLTVDHALYLGAELQKAEMALNLQKPDLYQQDKPLKLNTNEPVIG